jgi:hypothetical protein
MDIYDELNLKKNGFASIYLKTKNEFRKKKLNNYSCEELEEKYDCFQGLLERIIELSKEYFKKIIDNDTKHNNKMYFDLSCIYISEIQHLYLDRINYRLNQKNNNKSLRLAWIVAIVSFILSIISIFLTIHYGNSSSENKSNQQSIEKIDTPSLKFDSTIDNYHTKCK